MFILLIGNYIIAITFFIIGFRQTSTSDDHKWDTPVYLGFTFLIIALAFTIHKDMIIG